MTAPRIPAANLTREHLGTEVVVRMGKDRIPGIVQRITHFPTSVTVQVGGEHGWHICCLDLDSPVEVAS